MLLVVFIDLLKDTVFWEIPKYYSGLIISDKRSIKQKV